MRILSNSQAQAFNKCNKAWEWEYVFGLRRKPYSRDVHKLRGQFMHALMAYWFNQREVNTMQGVMQGLVLGARETNPFDPEWRVTVDLAQTEAWEAFWYYIKQIEAWFDREKLTVASTSVFGDVYDHEKEWPGEHATEFPFRNERLGLRGIVDMIVYNHREQAYFVVDWKLRGRMGYPGDYVLDPQARLYAMALRDAGVDVQGGYMVEMNYKLPKPATINKGNGKPAKRATHSFWQFWWDSIPEDVREHMDERQWMIDMEPKLKGEGDFFRIHEINNLPAVDEELEHRLGVTRANMALVEAHGGAAGVFAPHICRFCDYRTLCETQMSDGDVAYVAELEYERTLR